MKRFRCNRVASRVASSTQGVGSTLRLCSASNGYIRYDKYCQRTCGFCSAEPTIASESPAPSPAEYQPTLYPSGYCGDNNFKSAFPIICFVFFSPSACCESYKKDGGCLVDGVFASGGHYHGYCARSCLYCGPTAAPTLPRPSPAPSTWKPTSSQAPTANCNDGFLLRDAKDFLRLDLNLSDLCLTLVRSACL